MEFIPIKTRIMQPPQDDLFVVLDEYLTDVKEGDVVLISSKVLAIHQGRCVPTEGTNKDELIKQEAEQIIPTDYKKYPITIKYHAFIGTAGIDESNSNGYYTLLPENIFKTTAEIYRYLKEKHNLQNVGVVITDSHSQPFRFGAIGIALSFWGFRPLESHIGKTDLFGRAMKVERSNLADALAAGAGLVSGEVAECQPIVIARGVPNLKFADSNQKEELMASYEEDHFRALYEHFLK